MIYNRKEFFPEPNALESVAQFHNLFRCPVLDAPSLPPSDRSKLRVNLLQEEVEELAEAIKANDLVEVADALADIQYVLSGAVLEFGEFQKGLYESAFFLLATVFLILISLNFFLCNFLRNGRHLLDTL